MIVAIKKALQYRKYHRATTPIKTIKGSMFIVAYFPTKRKEDFTMKKIKNMTAAEAKEAPKQYEQQKGGVIL